MSALACLEVLPSPMLLHLLPVALVPRRSVAHHNIAAVALSRPAGPPPALLPAPTKLPAPETAGPPVPSAASI